MTDKTTGGAAEQLQPHDDLAPRALPPRAGNGWDSVLSPDERLLWQGRPAKGFWQRAAPGPREMALTAVGTVIVALALALGQQGWAGYRAGDAGAGIVLGGAGIGVALGLGWIVLPVLAQALRRRGTRYALTNRRALIETDFMGRGLAAWPIGEHSPIWRSRGRATASVWFALYRPPPRPMLLRPSGRMSGERPVGFERIERPDDVLALLERVRDGRA